ncbi:Zinc finger protein [Cucumispora dikerogammari]|nr:Zinc finger protein [Cucumispora dikerogammari]
MPNSGFTCKICNKKTQSSYGYKEHMLTHIETADFYPCQVCFVCFTNRPDLLNHLQCQHHMSQKNIRALNTWKPFRDIVSIRIFAYINDLHTHYGVFNPLLRVFCFGCIRYPKNKVHKCVKHKIQLRFCLMCRKYVGDLIEDFVEHLLEKCERNLATFQYERKKR